MQRKRVLITGPGGRVGPHLIPLLRPHYSLCLLDFKPLPPDLIDRDEFVLADIKDFEAIKQACHGVDAVVHLAAVSDEDDFRSKLLPNNVEGAFNIFEAARLAGISKVIFISTCQAVLHHGKGEWVTAAMPPRPWTMYACTKVFGETLARYYSDHHGMSVICLRLGWFQNYDSPELLSGQGHLREWCSPRDFAQLLVKSIETEQRFGLYFAISRNTGRFWDISSAQQEIGYDPQDDAFRFTSALPSSSTQ